ncbi:MAG: putative transrane protein [Phenylobacterium sp.]|nr:putative transrane protein [Phenylobacterium sp.]
MSRVFRSCISACAATAVLSLAHAACASDLQDDQIKAAVVYNFARFAAWPGARFADADAPVVLCVDPADRLSPALLQLEGQPVGTRTLHVRTVQSFGPSCHLAFVPASDSGHVGALQRQGVLTVGQAPEFPKSGAICLVTVGRQIRFEINATAAREAGVTLSSQLMRLAIVVRQ